MGSYIYGKESTIFIIYEGASIKISFDLSQTVSQLKQYIEEKIGINQKDQDLCFNNIKISDNTKTLLDYGIKGESKITLYIIVSIRIFIMIKEGHDIYLGPFNFRRDDSIDKVKQIVYDKYYIPIHRQQYYQNGKIINKISDIMDFFPEINLRITSPLDDDLIEAKVLDCRNFNSDGGIKDFNIKIDYFYVFDDIYRQIIKEKSINKKNIFILYNNKNYIDEKDHFEIFKKNYFKENITFVLKDYNDKIEVKIIDQRKNDNLGTFLIKVDLFGNIIEQIKQNKNINDKSIYLIHDGNVFRQKYPINYYLKDKILNNEEIIFYLDNQLNFMQLFIKTFTGETISMYVTPSDTIEYLKNRIQHELDQIEMNAITLLFAGKQLYDMRLISDYNIQGESTLHMALRLRGG